MTIISIQALAVAWARISVLSIAWETITLAFITSCAIILTLTTISGTVIKKSGLAKALRNNWCSI